MAMNRIQFQTGLSMPEFLKRYGTEAQCPAALAQARWPTGFRCPRCDRAAYSRVRGRTHALFQCQACRHQTSLIAGTVMQGTKLALTVWFLAIYLISQAKTGLSALALMRQLRVSYPTAWLIHHKLMQAMAEREERYVLEGQVQVDDAYLGGERSGGKVGRGSENKVPFVAAVSLAMTAIRCASSSPPSPASASRPSRSRPSPAWPLAAPCSRTGWPALPPSPRPGACISRPSSPDESRRTCPSSSGSTPYWATSRPV
jgi:transposase-like protein